MNARRAYSLLQLKAVGEDDERELTGIASTPTPDRQEDILEPKGAIFTLPIPLLWQHRASEPIGEVYAARVTDTGIEIKARIAKVTEPGRLKDRLDEAWQTIKAGLVRGLSVGWLPKEFARIQNSYGVHAYTWEWHELSAVTVPANAEATILAVKSYDTEGPPASGRRASTSPTTPGASGKAVRLLPTRQETTMKTLTEQLTHYKSTRDAKYNERQGLMTKAADEGRTLDDAESQAYDALDAEIKALDRHIARLETEITEQKSAAVAPTGGDPQGAAASRSSHASHSVITVTPNIPAGIGFARAVMCKTVAFIEGMKGAPTSAADVARQRYPDDARLHRHLKAAIPAATPTDQAWAGALIDPTNLAGEFIDFLRPQTIIGKFGTGNVPSLRRVPFNVRILGATSGANGYWVGAGAPAPVTKFDVSPTSLAFAKVASIAVIAEEVVRFSTPSAEALVRDELAKAQIERVDVDLIDPTVAAVANVSPASLTYGLVALAPSGTSADAARADIARLLKTYLDANMNPASAVVIMPNALCLALSIMRNSLGQKEFPDLTMNGGTFEGLPVIASQYAANRSGYGNLVVVVNAQDVFLSDDGQVTVDASREASLQMLDNPTNSAASGTATTMVSMWQTESVALKAHRFINWAKRRSTSVVYMDDVNWGSIGSPA